MEITGGVEKILNEYVAILKENGEVSNAELLNMIKVDSVLHSKIDRCISREILKRYNARRG